MLFTCVWLQAASAAAPMMNARVFLFIKACDFILQRYFIFAFFKSIKRLDFVLLNSKFVVINTNDPLFVLLK